MPVDGLPPSEIISNLGAAVKQLRLENNWSRQTLSIRSGVPESSIKRFETVGHIGLASLVDIAIALDRAEEIQGLFQPKRIPSIKEIDSRKLRKRGSQ